MLPFRSDKQAPATFLDTLQRIDWEGMDPSQRSQAALALLGLAGLRFLRITQPEGSQPRYHFLDATFEGLHGLEAGLTKAVRHFLALELASKS